MKFATGLLTTSFVAAATALGATTITLYDPDLEAPAASNDDDEGADVNIFRNFVNDDFGDQPPGFSFTEAFTVETLNITGSARGSGSAVFGTRPFRSGRPGRKLRAGHAVRPPERSAQSPLRHRGSPVLQPRHRRSSIDLSSWSGPFTPLTGIEPEFQFTL